MSERVALWGGWSLELPDGCQWARNADGSWSGWDESHVIDVDIIETSGRQDGSPITPEEMIGNARGDVHELSGAIARVFTEVEETGTADGPQPIEWTRVNAGAVNTTLLMGIGNTGLRDAEWHDQIWRSLRHAAEARRGLGGLFGRR